MFRWKERCYSTIRNSAFENKWEGKATRVCLCACLRQTSHFNEVPFMALYLLQLGFDLPLAFWLHLKGGWDL